LTCVLAFKVSIKGKIRNSLPEPVFNNLLLTFPFLYKTKFVNYESNIALGNSLEELFDELDKVLDLEGDIIECGCARCGTSILIADYLRRKGINKKIYACDTFGGFDQKEHNIEKKLGLTSSKPEAFAHNSYEYVIKKIKKLGFSENITPVKGFFEETLPKLHASFCFALIDCDLKNSIIFSAKHVWKNLSRDGIILFDDYTSDKFKGAKEGIDFFVNNFKKEIVDHGLKKNLYFVRRI